MPNKKTVGKPRRWRCQGVPAGKRRCQNLALFESTKSIGDSTWHVPFKVKLCVPCDKNFTHMTRVPLFS